jgi:hypothetical protein
MVYYTWSTCYSGEAQTSSQRLFIEILTKLSIHDMNLDRITSLFHIY